MIRVMFMLYKTCPSCGDDLPLDRFGVVKSRPDGRAAYCKECRRAKDRERYSDPAKRAKHLAYMKSQYEKNRPHKLAQAKRYRDELRDAALLAYSHGAPPMCQCCGDTHREFLEIDHVENNGAEHRREVGSTIQVLRWLRKNNYPSGFQLLCRNCNHAKWVYGSCPHSSVA